jgi:hypothetical protein
MRSYLDSDVFNIINRGNAFQSKLLSSIRKINKETIVNDKVKSSIEAMKRVYKESILLKATEAVNKKRILLICPPIEDAFVEYFPYVKAKVSGENKVIVDISRFTTIDRDDTGKPLSYNVDVVKLYNFLIPAYISLELLGPHTVLGSDTIRYLSSIWARMFCNVLMSNSMGVLQNHHERYQAFMYYTMRFFMTYYLGSPEAVVNKISNGYIDNKKSEYILFIENNLTRREDDAAKMYTGFFNYCEVMLNNDITNIKGMNQRVKDTNQSEFLAIYRNQYGMNALMSLCSVDYFINTIFNGWNKSNYLRDKGMENILVGKRGEYKKECPKLFDSIFREL